MDELVCILCGQGGGGVTSVATCGNKCTIEAHLECFRKRATAPSHRKKHHARANNDAELCLTPGCTAKVQLFHIPKVKRDRNTENTVSYATFTKHVAEERDLEDPERPCSFTGRDGRPCCRVAVKDGACRLHARDAYVMRRMVEELTREETSKATMTDVETVHEEAAMCSTSVGTQTDDDTKDAYDNISHAQLVRDLRDALAREELLEAQFRFFEAEKARIRSSLACIVASL